MSLLKELQDLNLKNSSCAEVLSILKRISTGIPFQTIQINAGQFVYRSRKHSPDIEFSFPQDLGYRTDTQNITRPGRCNKEFSSIFYSALSTKEIRPPQIFTVLETSNALRNNISDIETHTISKWLVKKTMRVAVISYSPDYKGHQPYFDFLSERFEGSLSQTKDPEFNKELANFLAKEFSKEVLPGSSHEYLISAAYSQLLYENGFYGVLYPGVQSKFKGANLALLPAVVDENLEFSEAVLMQLHKANEEVKLAQFKRVENKFLQRNIPFEWEELDPSYQIGMEWEK